MTILNPSILEFTRPSGTVNSDHPDVVAYARQNAGPSEDPVERVVALYYAVRDDIRYDPYTIDFSIDGFKASTTLSTGRGWCVTKAILLAACCRTLGIPARLGFADVRNHLSTRRMRETMKTDVFFWHGYTSIYLNEKWIKATPAFNIELTEKFKLRPLEFDGLHDSIYHPFDLAGNRHMEYLHDRGEHVDVPMGEMAATFRAHYDFSDSWNSADFEAEVEAEVG